ncbi:hypothetical protein PWT90_05125 [Aphanocladium album]|nr:hypothetical protein PWT90_05125 [Aphanocladium album]
MCPHKTPAPTRFRCKVGGEWKSLTEFSNAQQRMIQHGNVDPAHSGMTCKEHSAGSRSELRCELCLLVKPIDEFSKNSRRKGDYQCRRCVAWVEIQEPTLTPGPLETGHISPEEEQQQMLRQRFFTSEDFLPYDDDEDLVPRAPITILSGFDEEAISKAMGKASVAEFLSHTGDMSSTRSVASRSSQLPPHLRSKAPSEASMSACVSETSSVHGDTAPLPPHLRAKYGHLASSSAASSSAGNTSMPTTLRDADSDAASMMHRSFNAWDPSGNMARRKADSVTNDTMSETASASTQNDDPNVVGDWTKVTGPKTTLPKGRARWGKDDRMSPADLRKSQGDVHQPYMRREIDSQKQVKPLDAGADSE